MCGSRPEFYGKRSPINFGITVTYPSIPTKYARYTFVFPETKPIVFHAYNNTTQPIIEKKGGTVKYSFVFENTAYSENEDFMPPADAYYRSAFFIIHERLETGSGLVAGFDQ